MDHPNCIKLYGQHAKWEDYIVMEMELGQESLGHYSKAHQEKFNRPLSEAECARIMQGLLKGIAYMHDVQGVIHRDLKPDNVLIGDCDDLGLVKIIDFGLACKDKASETITDFLKCGTFLYKPPEQICNVFAFAKKADIWAAGVIMYEILTGSHPMWKPGEPKEVMEAKMKTFKEFKYPRSMSRHAKHLISMLCQPSISARYRAAEALQHPWITRDLDAPQPKSNFEDRELAL